MADKQSDSKLSKVLSWFISPLAIGIYIAIGSALIAKNYYKERFTSSPSIFMQALRSVDQKSIDARFKLRGERKGDPQVAILAIDDRSLDIVGRWPWPRATLAHALENTFRYGAKVIASDVVFSEKTDRPEIRLVQKLRQETKVPGNIDSKLQQDLDDTDNDKIYGQFVNRHKANIILGSFFYQNPYYTGMADPCYDVVYQGSDFSTAVQQQAKPLVVISENEIAFPKEFSDIYKTLLDQIEADTRKSNPLPTTEIENYQLNKDILENKLQFCDNSFLDPSSDDVAAKLQKNWPAIKSVVAGLTAPTFEDWKATYEESALKNLVTNARKWNVNVPEIQSQAQNTGFFNASIDDDGVIRRAFLIARTGTQYMPSIALQAYLTATNTQTDIHVGAVPGANGARGIKSFAIANSDGDTLFQVPVDPSGQMMINYAGAKYMFPHASIADMLDEAKPDVNVTEQVLNNGKWTTITHPVSKAEFFKNKILILGATAIGVYDMRNTPFDGEFPGSETHANVISNLLQRNFLRYDSREQIYMPWLLFGLGVALALALAHFGAFTGMFITAAVLFALGFIDRQFLFGKGIVISIAFPIIEVSAMYIALTFYKYLTEERAKKELRGTFSKYVSPAIVNEILKDPKNLELGGRKERITIFFSDVRGFTTISEKLDPRALSDLLNSYLTPMTDLVFKHRGTLDKYMGDAIMAFFGAPIHYPNHAQYACRCALDSLQKLTELQAMYKKKGLPVIDIGIGLNTGECSVGNMGSQKVRNYTVMGDAVNLASRLEGINKTYGTRVIISEYTYADVKNDFVCREVDWVRVKGKLQPVKIYELLAEGKPQSNIIELAKYFTEGYNLYHQKDFSQAIHYFEQAIGKSPTDSPSRLYIERCQEFLEEPPPEDWDGVYVMKTK